MTNNIVSEIPTFTANMNWIKYIENAAKAAAARKVGSLYHAGKPLTPASIVYLYEVIIRPCIHS